MATVRLSVEERREELLRAAVQQIASRGVSAVRVQDVAAALGVSNALVLYHFSTKEQLVCGAFTHAVHSDTAHLRKLLGRRTTALRRLRAALRWYAPTGGAKNWRLWLEGWAFGRRHEALREVTRDADRQWRSAMREVLREGVAAGEFACPDPEHTVLRLTAFLDGLVVQMTAYGHTIARHKVHDWLDDALTRELGVDRAALRTVPATPKNALAGVPTPAPPLAADLG
ncbi:TetR family transcriptional regulator [Streptomyces sp. NA04227]|uniref:TetR/AcrR family transcriptional regulator n=1 Tax=Streptomyces sp. NA04227 TaxID=2742136 RepID=UPI0015911F00|nr:TetR family transcriptional regulator C-terminal domain-containing protein [Streptomyces sp. NA04227]QKW10248.1 TetR family transcriptional regulator [Streptomyces sp. NA04227]